MKVEWRSQHGRDNCRGVLDLHHTAEIDAYLSQREAAAASLKSEVEKRFDAVGVRARLLARRNTGVRQSVGAQPAFGTRHITRKQAGFRVPPS